MDDGIVVKTLDACWAAIDNWSALNGVFGKKYRTDNELAYLAKSGPGPGDIGKTASLALKPTSFTITTRTNQGIAWPMGIRADLYLGLGSYRLAWNLLEEVIHAIYSSRPNQSSWKSPTFVESAACSPVQSVVAVGVTEQKVSSLQPAQQDLTFLVASATFMFLGKTNPFPSNE